VSNHLFRNVNGDEVFAVMHSERKADELWGNVTVTSPSFDNFLVATFGHLHDFLEEFRIYVGAFFE